MLTSGGFVVGLSLLLLNDLFLKARFHNPLTGKLSDFAGLFVFPLFWAALLPRFRRASYLLTAAAFVLWKSAYSGPLIDAWNRLGLLRVGRTVDATDLLALAILPLSYLYSSRLCSERAAGRLAPRVAPYVVAAFSLFAFTATSYRSKFDYDDVYRFQMSKTELTRRVYNLDRLDREFHADPCGFAGVTTENIRVSIPSDFCFTHVNAAFAVGEEQGQAFVRLKEMEHECPGSGGDKDALRSVFEKRFVARLNEAPPAFYADELPEPARAEGRDASSQLYLLPVGELPGSPVRELAASLKRQLGVKVEVLKPLPAGDAARDPKFPTARLQAERLADYAGRENQKILSKPGAVLIGVAQDFYVQGAPAYYPTHYVKDGRLALVSLDGLDPKTFCEPPDDELLRTRLRKLTAKLYADASAGPTP